jgi:2-dehydropantoate 2-reductase
MAALTSHYGLSMDRVVQEHRDELVEIMKEIVELAQKKGIALDQAILDSTLHRMEKTPNGAKTSMQLDLEQKKPAEIEALVGYIVHEGSRLGVPTPTVESLYQTLRF